MRRLTHSADRAFESVRQTLLKETRRSFIKRYLRRRETKDELAGCESTLTFALNLFGVSTINSYQWTKLTYDLPA